MKFLPKFGDSLRRVLFLLWSRRPSLGFSISLSRLISQATFVLVALSTAFLVPLTVSYDGYLYIGSGYALLNPALSYQYHWVREPLYPLFVGILSQLGGFQLLVFVQAMLLLVSIHAIVRHFWPRDQRDSKLVLIVTLSVYFLLYGFSASVLQQVLILAFATAFYKTLFGWEGRYCQVFLISIVMPLAYLTSAILAAGLLVILATQLFFLKSVNLISRIYLAVAGGAMTLLAHYVWSRFKLTLYANSDSLMPYEDFSGGFNAFNSFSFTDKLFAVPSSLLALNGVGIEFYQGNFSQVGNELRIFSTPKFAVDQNCGRLFPGPENYISNSVMNLNLACVPGESIEFLSAINALLSLGLVALCFLGFFLVGKALLTRLQLRHWQGALAIMAPQLSIIPYAISNGAISRYGIFPIAINLVFAVSYLLRFRLASSD